jgi:hypothetical protein
MIAFARRDAMRQRGSEPLKWDLRNSLEIETRLGGAGRSILNSFLIEQTVKGRDDASVALYLASMNSINLQEG